MQADGRAEVCKDSRWTLKGSKLIAGAGGISQNNGQGNEKPASPCNAKRGDSPTSEAPQAICDGKHGHKNRLRDIVLPLHSISLQKQAASSASIRESKNWSTPKLVLMA